MKQGWKQTTIGDQVLLQRGNDITRADQRPGNVPVVSSGGIASYHDTASAKGPGVVLGRKGVVGSAYYIATDFWPHDTTLWIKDFKGNDPRFVYYFFRFKAPLLVSLDVGSANPTLNRNHVHPSPTLWPPYQDQLAIAAVLSALDDKIELNRQTNETLESMARALFKSWFVDFDPVRAKMAGRAPFGMDAATAALFPSSIHSTLPSGWSFGTFGDVIDLHDSRRVPLSARERDARPGPFPYYGAAGLVDRVDGYLFEGTHTLIGEDGSVVHDDGTPYVQYVWDRFWVNNHAHVLRGRGVYSEEVVLLIAQHLDVRPFVTGAVQAKLSQGSMKAIPVVHAPDPVVGAFARAIAPFFARIRASIDESRTLAELRDLLLPKLLSGELRIREAERAVEAAL